MKKFKIPEYIKNPETKTMINSLIKGLEENGCKIRPIDFPSFHRMATAYDNYITSSKAIAKDGATMTNGKGEVVKRPDVNIQKENWAQFLEIAKEYGMTAKSGRTLKMSVSEEEDSPFERFVKEGIERR